MAAALPPSVRKGFAFPFRKPDNEAMPPRAVRGAASHINLSPVRQSLTARKAAKPLHTLAH